MGNVDRGLEEGSFGGSAPPYVDSIKEKGVPTKNVEIFVTHGQKIPLKSAEKMATPPMEYSLGASGPILGSTSARMLFSVG